MTAKEALKLCEDLAVLHAKINAAGLFKTGHAMHAAVQAAGYECAEKLSAQSREG